MKRAARGFAPIVTLLVAALPALAQQGIDSWQPGQYRGLVTGKSTAEDVVRVLGKPTWQGPPVEAPAANEIQYHYGLASSDDPCCDVFFKNNILQAVSLTLGRMSRKQAEQRFGGDFVAVRFSIYDDDSSSGSAPICEDPKGATTLLLNPRKGLTLWVDPQGDVSTATYSATRPGLKHCPARSKK